MAYPEPAAAPAALDEAERLKVGAAELEPSRLSIAAGQGAIFEVGIDGAAIVAELAEPDDGPPEEAPRAGLRHVRRRNPRSSG